MVTLQNQLGNASKLSQGNINDSKNHPKGSQLHCNCVPASHSINYHLSSWTLMLNEYNPKRSLNVWRSNQLFVAQEEENHRTDAMASIHLHLILYRGLCIACEANMKWLEFIIVHSLQPFRNASKIAVSQHIKNSVSGWDRAKENEPRVKMAFWSARCTKWGWVNFCFKGLKWKFVGWQPPLVGTLDGWAAMAYGAPADGGTGRKWTPEILWTLQREER